MASDVYLIKRLTAPSTTAVTLAEAKAQCVVEHNDHDTLITRLIKAAVDHVERVTSVSLVRQQWRRYLPAFESQIYLPRGPVQSVEQVQYVDGNGVTQTLAGGVYELDAVYPRLLRAYGQTWPGTQPKVNAVWVDYWTGYFDGSVSPIASLTESIPEDLRHAVLLLVSDLYLNRESQMDVQVYKNPAFDILVAPYRNYLQ